MTSLGRALVTVSIAWAALLPVAPFAASQPAPAPVWYWLAFLLYDAGRLVCHQMPLRSFHLWSVQLPVCARCTGLYFGAAVAAAGVAWLRPARPAPAGVSDEGPGGARWLLAVSASPTAATLAYEWATGDTPSNAIRALAGAALGAAAAVVAVGALTKRQT